MPTLNLLLNHVEEMNEDHSFFTRQVLSRGTTVIYGWPIEFIEFIQTLIRLPYQASQIALQMPTRVIVSCIDSPNLKEYHSSLSTADLFATARKIVAYVVGLLATATLGALCPSLNFRLHIALGLAVDLRQQRMLREIREREQQEKEKQEKVLIEHFQTVLHTMKQQMAEKEQIRYTTVIC